MYRLLFNRNGRYDPPRDRDLANPNANTNANGHFDTDCYPAPHRYANPHGYAAAYVDSRAGDTNTHQHPVPAHFDANTAAPHVDADPGALRRDRRRQQAS